MSFEGYYRVLCKNGHLNEQDVYEGGSVNSSWKCYSCGAPSAWYETIDTTNEEDSPSYPLTLLEPCEEHKCECCGHYHASEEPAVYEIPKVEDDTFYYDESEIEQAVLSYFEKHNHPERRVVSVCVTTADPDSSDDYSAVIVTQPRRF